MIVSLAACKGSENGNNSTNPPASSTGDYQQSGNESGNSNTSQSGNNAEAAKLTGKLNLIELDDRDPSVLRGVIIKGNHAGGDENGPKVCDQCGGNGHITHGNCGGTGIVPCQGCRGSGNCNACGGTGKPNA